MSRPCLRPCLKPSPFPSPCHTPALTPSPCTTPSAAHPPRAVHFPPTPALRTVHPAHAKSEYDRTPIAPPTDQERACALPARGCPGRNYDLYAIDRVAPPPPSSSSVPALSHSASSSSEGESDDNGHCHADLGASSVKPVMDTQFLPHAPVPKRRSASPSFVDGRESGKERERERERKARPGAVAWSGWSSNDDSTCLGGF